MKVIVVSIFIIVIFVIIVLILAPGVLTIYENYFEWCMEKIDEIKERRHKDE